MRLDAFRASLAGDEPPSDWSAAMRALWWDAKGEWDRSHACAQENEGADAARVHAYLHRKEGDDANAAYWYRRAGRPVASGSWESEWTAIVTDLLAS